MSADDTTKTKQEIARAESVKAIMEEQAAAGASIAATLDKIIEKHGEIGKALTKQLGDMEKYATDAEKLHLVESQIAETSQLKLDRMNELKRLEEKRLELAAQMDAAIAAAADTAEKEIIRADKRYKLTEYSEDRLNDLRQLGVSYTQDAIDLQEEAVEASKKQAKETGKIVKAQGETEALMQQTLETTLGLKDTTGDMADVLIDTLGTTRSFSEAMQGAGKAMSQAFTKTRMLKSVKNHLSDIADTAWKNLTAMDGLQMQWEEMDSRLTRATGATKAHGAEAKQLSLTMLDQSFTIERTEAAYGNLYKSSQAFSQLTTEGRKALTEQALQFERIGVNADTFAASVDGLNKVFGDTPEDVNKTTEELSNFARAMGVGPNEMLAEFNKQLPLLARYGKEQGVKMFKELAATAKLAGLEMSDLLNVAGKFDTFEGAAEAAGKLNFMLGGPMINSMEMLNATEEDRIKMLRESVAASGKSFETMGRFEKDLIAKTLGVDVSVAQKLFSDQNLNNIEEAQAAFAGQADEMGSLASQAEKAKTLEEEKAANAQRSLKHTQELSETMKGIHKIMNQISGFFSEYGVYLLPVIGIFKMISWWIAFTSSQFGQSILTRLGLVRASAAEEGIIHKMKLAADYIRTEIWYAWERSKEIAQNAWKWLQEKKMWLQQKIQDGAKKALKGAFWVWERMKEGAQWAWKQMMRLKNWVAEKTMMNESRAGILAHAAWKKVTEGAQWAWIQMMRLKDFIKEKAIDASKKALMGAFWIWEKAKEGAQFIWKQVMRVKDFIKEKAIDASKKALMGAFWIWEKAKEGAQFIWKQVMRVKDWVAEVAMLAKEKAAKIAFWVWEKGALVAAWAFKKILLAKEKAAKIAFWVWEKGALVAAWAFKKILLAKETAFKLAEIAKQKSAAAAAASTGGATSAAASGGGMLSGIKSFLGIGAAAAPAAAGVTAVGAAGTVAGGSVAAGAGVAGTALAGTGVVAGTTATAVGGIGVAGAATGTAVAGGAGVAGTALAGTGVVAGTTATAVGGVGVAAAGAGAATSTAFLPIIAIVLAIIAVLGLLWYFWDDVSGFFMATIGAIGGVFKWLGGLIVDVFVGALGIVKAVFKGFLKGIVWLVEGVMQGIFSPITAMIEGLGMILDFIPGLGSVADGLRSFSPGRIIHKYAGELRATIDGFADGGTNIKGGAAIVGEKGPEMLTLGQGSNVITNESLEKAFGLSAQQEEKNNAEPPWQDSLLNRLDSAGTQASTGPDSQWAGTHAAVEASYTDSLRQTAATRAELDRTSPYEKDPYAAAPAPSPAPAETGGGTTTINITLELDGEVLAKHTEEVAMGAMSKAFAFPP